MIDLALLRENTNSIVDTIKRKDPSFNVEKLIKLEDQLRKLKIEVEELRHKKNSIAQQGKSGVTEELKTQARELSVKLKQQEIDLEKLETEFKDIYLRCPNLLKNDVPNGNKEDNAVIKTFGKMPEFKFTPKNHVELGNINGWFDFEAAAKMTASNFALYKNDAVKLAYSLMMFMLNNNMKYGFSPIIPPYLVNYNALEGASNFPRFKDEVYCVTEDNLYLTPTSEVNLTSIYKDCVLKQEELPIKMTAWTSCFRREAGTYGAQERGLIRIHQFEKVELYTICDPENSDKEQLKMLECAENILQQLGLHYRVSLLAAQDCSFASAKTYDIEVWMPGQGVYKEVSSSSNCTDFQARRSNIRFKKDLNSKSNFVNTLNASSLALPRLMVALMETYQQEDGSIKIPEILKTISINW